MKATLRPYQMDAVNKIRAEFSSGRKAVLFVLPTGGGKTFTYSYIGESAAAKGNRILILEHRKELIRQASLSLGQLDVRHRVIAPPDKVAGIRRAHVETMGWPMIDNASTVAVASVQTLARRMEWLQQFNPRMVIIDEAHHAVAGTWSRIIEALPRASLLGVTATPCRTDGQGLGDVFDAMVLGPSMAELIDMGALVPPRVFAPPVQVDLSAVHQRGGDYDAAELANLLDKPTVTGDAVQHYNKLAPGRPAIVFCASVKHATHVAEAFRGAGWRFEVVTGDMEDSERDRCIHGLATGALHGIVTVDIVSEGTDIPVAEVAIMLRATQSESLFLQQAGRVLRPAPGKEYGLILDHVGNVLRHGMPDAQREWSLDGRKKRGRGASASEPTIRVIQCPMCYAAHPPSQLCPACGYAYPAAGRAPEQRDGELMEITPEALAAKQARMAQGKARTIAQLKAMGMSDARAAHVMAAREEKDRLRLELRGLVDQYQFLGYGYPVETLREMKPKQLRTEIERLRSEIGHIEFMQPVTARSAAHA